MADKLTLERIKTAHPLLRNKMEQDYIDCNRIVLGKYVRLRYTSVYRDFEDQGEKYQQGRTKPGKIITNAKPGQSLHNYGLAKDIVLLYDNDKNGSFEEASWDMFKDGDDDKKADWDEVVKFMKARGWVWGGDFKSFSDKPHFQYTFGYTWQQLIKMPKDKDGYPILS